MGGEELVKHQDFEHRTRIRCSAKYRRRVFGGVSLEAASICIIGNIGIRYMALDTHFT